MKRLNLFRKVRYWIRYRPAGKLLIASYRTKAKATAKQRVGEVVFDVIGFYAPGMIRSRPARRKSA